MSTVVVTFKLLTLGEKTVIIEFTFTDIEDKGTLYIHESLGKLSNQCVQILVLSLAGNRQTLFKKKKKKSIVWGEKKTTIVWFLITPPPHSNHAI